MQMLMGMKSTHKKDKVAGYRSFPDLIEAYSDAVAEIIPSVKHTDGNDLGVGHVIEYLYAHMALMNVEDRATFVREMRRSYTAWLERREIETGKPAGIKKGSGQVTDLADSDSHREDSGPKKKRVPKGLS